MATTSKEGSRRENYPMLTQWGSDKKYQHGAFLSHDGNDQNVNRFDSNWRASLVPAAAVIPAPIMYIIVAAVKKFVVGFLFRNIRSSFLEGNTMRSEHLCGERCYPWISGSESATVYLEKIRVFQAGVSLNTLAWNNNKFRFYLAGTLDWDNGE